MEEPDKLAHFEQLMLPHLDAAHNLAYWLTRNEHDACDVVQEAYLRAFRYFGSFRGTNSRAWLLTIVRNSCYSWLKQNRSQEMAAVFDEEIHQTPDAPGNPAQVLLQNASVQSIRDAMEALPVEVREIVILREMEGQSYKEIAEIAGIPIGTVMSRLARGRKLLQRRLARLTSTAGDHL